MVMGVEQIVQGSIDKLLDEFFCSVEGGDSKLLPFLSSWNNLDATVKLHSDKLRQSTLSSVLSVATTISAIASSILDLQDTSTKIREEFDSDVAQVLHHDLEHLSISGKPEYHHENLQSYIEACHSWLLTNLQNPYPSNKTKNTISKQTNSSIKSIDSWFVDARRRIGWNKIRRTRFSSRAEMIDAADVFFNNHNPFSRNSLREDVCIEFVAMRNKALALCPQDGDLVQPKSNESRRTPLLKKHDSNVKPVPTPCVYPSPVSSRSGSPRTFPQVLSPRPICDPITTRKRSVTPVSDSMFCKRRRVEVATEVVDLISHLPSPASSISLLDCFETSPPSISVALPSYTSCKRKRDSQDDDSPSPKRLHCLVSKSPASSPSDNLEEVVLGFKPELPDLTVNLPPAVATLDVDDTTPLDIFVPPCPFPPTFFSNSLLSMEGSPLPAFNDYSFFNSLDAFRLDHLSTDFDCLNALELHIPSFGLPDCAFQSGVPLSVLSSQSESVISPSQLELVSLFDIDVLF